MAQVRFENVSFKYGENQIIKNFNLDIDDGEIMGIVGPSGSGKTTIIRLLCGFINPYEGRIFIGDRCVYDASKRINIPPEQRNVGVVFQDYAVWPHLTVLENVVYPLKKQKVGKAERVKKAEEILDLLEMLDYKSHLPSQLSGGQQQRVAIARSLVTSDDLIVLDEPITNLDLKLREQMLIEIREIQKRIGTTFIYVSNDQEASLRLCDQVTIIDHDGAINQIGRDIDLVTKPINRFVFQFIGVTNFIPVEIRGNEIYIESTDEMVVIDNIDAIEDSSKEYELAIRPTDIEINQDSKLKVVVESATFLGNNTNYFIRLGKEIIRFNRMALDVLDEGIFKPGDKMGIEFTNKVYYEKEGDTIA